MNFETLNVGVIGCGQLGLSIAIQFITKGLPQENLHISFSGNPDTAKRIASSGLTSCITTNTAIAEVCNLIFLTVKPSNITNMLKMKVQPESMLVSCVAGHEIKTIEALFHHPVVKIMPTSPASIENETAICGIYPRESKLEAYLNKLGFELFFLTQESEFHYFTAMACLPAALLQLSILHIPIDENMLFEEAKNAQFAHFETLYRRLQLEVPANLSEAEANLFIKKMATKGGITECIVDRLKIGSTLIQAVEHGIARSKEIAAN